MSLAGSALEAALQAVGRGLDAAGDHRLLYCKGAGRLVALDEARARDLPIGDSVLCGVPPDVEVEVYRGSPERNRPASPGGAPDEPFVCSFQKMAEHFNRKAGLLEEVPLGSINSLFSFTGSWKNDAAATKSLAIDGYSVPLYRVKITSDELILHENVKLAIPYSWDPSTLASFVENYGTHIITSVMVGGKDEVYINQHSSSQLSELEFKSYVREIRNERFSDGESKLNASPINYSEKDMTVVVRRRGGCDLVQSSIDWIRTVSSAPDVIGMPFLPILAFAAHLLQLLRAAGQDPRRPPGPSPRSRSPPRSSPSTRWRRTSPASSSAASSTSPTSTASSPRSSTRPRSARSGTRSSATCAGWSPASCREVHHPLPLAGAAHW